MATTPRHGLPYIYATWLTKVIAGDEQCTYQPWFKAHFRYEKKADPSFDFAAWTIDHKALVERHAAGLRADGWTVTIEDANAFKLFGKTALLSGKPDIIAERNGEVRVCDAKTGAPRHSDFVQVLIYMLSLLRTRGDIKTLSGAVVYQDRVVPVTREELTPAMEEKIFAAVRAAAAAEPPEASPSARGCSFCDIADCRFRVDEEIPAVMVAEF